MSSIFHYGSTLLICDQCGCRQWIPGDHQPHPETEVYCSICWRDKTAPACAGQMITVFSMLLKDGCCRTHQNSDWWGEANGGSIVVAEYTTRGKKE